MDDGEVSVVWIVEVARVVDVYHGLVGRSRSGGVGRVEEAGDVRCAGGWNVLVLAKHSVFEGDGQEHSQERRRGRRMEDGGEGGMGRSTYLYTDEWHRTRCWVQTRSRLYFTRGPQQCPD